MSDVEAFLLCSIPFVLVAFAWLAARKASYARGKADAFQQVANDFQGLSNCTWWPKSRSAAQAAERKKLWLSLALCDPRVCEALAEALTEAREHWRHPPSPAYDALETPPERVGTATSEAP